MLGLCWCWSYVGSKLGHVGSMSGLRGALLGPRRLMFDQNRGSVGPCWGYVGAITRWTGLCWPILGLCWAHLRSMLGPGSPILGLCWPIWGLCWGHVQISWSYLGAWLPLRRWFWASLFSGPHLHSQILLEKVPASGLRDSCLYSLSQSLLFFSSPQWPASFKFQAFLLPPVACESQVPPKRGVGGRVGSPP